MKTITKIASFRMKPLETHAWSYTKIENATRDQCLWVQNPSGKRLCYEVQAKPSQRPGCGLQLCLPQGSEPRGNWRLRRDTSQCLGEARSIQRPACPIASSLGGSAVPALRERPILL